MHRGTEELRQCGLAERALKAGDRAPSFTLNNPGGCRGILLRPPCQGSAGYHFSSVAIGDPTV
jgi:hypothetical protein